MSEIVELVKEFRFEAAHFLPNVPEGHKCRRVHGHSFRGEICVRGPLDPQLRWVVDFSELKGAIEPLVRRLDHYLLNEIEGLENPTAESIAVWIWNHLLPSLPGLARVTIEETCTSRCHYYGARSDGERL